MQSSAGQPSFVFVASRDHVTVIAPNPRQISKIASPIDPCGRMGGGQPHAMARAPRAGDCVGAEAAWAVGLDNNPVHSVPVRLIENGTPALGLINCAAAQRERTVHNSGGGGRVRARAAGAQGSSSASRPLHRRSWRRALPMAMARCPGIAQGQSMRRYTQMCRRTHCAPTREPGSIGTRQATACATSNNCAGAIRPRRIQKSPPAGSCRAAGSPRAALA